MRDAPLEDCCGEISSLAEWLPASCRFRKRICKAGLSVSRILFHLVLVFVDGILRDGPQYLILPARTLHHGFRHSVFIVFGDILHEFVRALEVKPAHILACHLAGPLVEQEVDGHVGIRNGHGCLIAFLDGARTLAQLVDHLSGGPGVTCLYVGLGCDEIGFPKARCHKVVGAA